MELQPNTKNITAHTMLDVLGDWRLEFHSSTNNFVGRSYLCCLILWLPRAILSYCCVVWPKI